MAVAPRVVLLEVLGDAKEGTKPDKVAADESGVKHRFDALAIRDRFRENGVDLHIHAYSDSNASELAKRLIDEKYVAYLPRVNPGEYHDFTKSKFYDFLRVLSNAGLIGFPAPDTLERMGGKDILYRVRHLFFGLPCTKKYLNREELLQGLLDNLENVPLNTPVRVIKQASGSSCCGIWVVKVLNHGQGRDHPETILLSCQEMVDNHIEEFNVQSFADHCEKHYLHTPGSYMVDQKFLPRITEGEVRLFMGCDSVLELMLRLPNAGSLSCGSAHSTKAFPSLDDPEFSGLIKNFRETLPSLREAVGMGNEQLPLLWCADFIRGEGTSFILGEINCSCVGFQPPHVQHGLVDSLGARLRDLLTQSK